MAELHELKMPAEKTIIDAIKNLAQTAANQHGIEIRSISFNWGHIIARPSHLIDCEVCISDCTPED